MRGNGEIAHVGIQKLAGPVAQLVIIVHLTAAFQRRDVYVGCIIPSVTPLMSTEGVKPLVLKRLERT